ncbi:MAG: hypothetical protein EP329_11040 [Deltaproteobacteria bacterium]|nr:MAG: hypothetical protein EP329_11040 [Deltaproteobacteria bacterium]
MRWIYLVAVSGLIAACADGASGDATRDFDGPGVAIDVAALNLQGVGDVVWDIEVENGATTPSVVWQRRLTSSGYGDGAGSASYVGPCDADPAANPNTVKVWVVGVYDGAVSTADAGTFNTTHDGVTGTAIAFQNPTSAASPLTQTVVCQENRDVAVQFDVALMRPAQQGFFDIAVNFNDIFCSAKLDCCADTNANGCEAGEDIQLLFDATGARARTIVLGFACTAGVADPGQTDLFMDALALDCDGADPFDADVVIDPSGVTGNQCAAGSLATCPAITAGAGVADTYLYQVAVFRGSEALTSGGVNAQKAYWNVALGVTASIASCRLRTRATADDALDDGDNVVDGVIAAGTVYPYVQWDVTLDGTCASEELTFGSDTAPVRAAYTGTGAAETTFAYAWAPGALTGSWVALRRTCKEILDAGEATGDHLYTVDLDGAGAMGPVDVYCDMTGGGYTLLTNVYDSAGDDAPNDIAYAVSGWQQTGSGSWSSTVDTVDRDISGTGSAAVSSAVVKGLWDDGAATVLRMCLVSTTNTEICRTSDDVGANITITTPPVGIVNTTLSSYYSGNGCTGTGCAAAYTYGRLMGLPASRNDYVYTSFGWSAFCITRTVGAYHEFGDQSPGLCEHNDSDTVGWRGVWHGWGNGVSFRPWEVNNNEMGNWWSVDPSTTSYGFRLWVR